MPSRTLASMTARWGTDGHASSVVYTVEGEWRGASVRISWDGARFIGPRTLVAALEAMVAPADDLQKLATALALIGRTLDSVDRLLVDDGDNPWGFRCLGDPTHQRDMGKQSFDSGAPRSPRTAVTER